MSNTVHTADRGRRPFAILVREIGEDDWWDNKPLKPGTPQAAAVIGSAQMDYVEVYLPCELTDEQIDCAWRVAGTLLHSREDIKAALKAVWPYRARATGAVNNTTEGNTP